MAPVQSLRKILIPKLLGLAHHVAARVLVLLRAAQSNVSHCALLVLWDLPHRHGWGGVDGDVSELVHSLHSHVLSLHNCLQVREPAHVHFVAKISLIQVWKKILNHGLSCLFTLDLSRWRKDETSCLSAAEGVV